jgi:hypothetical protein
MVFAKSVQDEEQKRNYIFLLELRIPVTFSRPFIRGFLIFFICFAFRNEKLGTKELGLDRDGKLRALVGLWSGSGRALVGLWSGSGWAWVGLGSGSGRDWVGIVFPRPGRLFSAIMLGFNPVGLAQNSGSVGFGLLV